jgi:hypothetical protein
VAFGEWRRLALFWLKVQWNKKNLTPGAFFTLQGIARM